MKIFSQLQRELREYRLSLLQTPFMVAGVLVLLMAGSVIFADRLSIIGDGVLQVLVHESGGKAVNWTVNIDDGKQQKTYTITKEDEPADDSEWNFSRDWNFGSASGADSPADLATQIESLNPVLNILHVLFLFVLMFVTANYALDCLYQDRRDRSILFWKSLPVSEWQEVLCKLAVATLLTPVAFLAASILTQLAYVLLAMLLVWRLDGEATALVLENIQFVPLFANQIGGVLIWVLWSAPLYAWLMVASAASRRSPAMLAIGIPVGLIFVEKVFVGSNVLSTAIFNHMPHLVGDDDSASMGMYLHGPVWSSMDYAGMALGLVATGLLVSAAVWLRRHRFDL